jgi:hypothetical protein
VGKSRVTVTFPPGSDTPEEVTEEQRNAALQRMTDFMRQGLDFGGERLDREEIYRERLEQLEHRRG